MDNSFISKDNIDNIYDNINVYFVKNHNYNLNSYDKYKKITKKLSKTIFNSIKNNDSYKNVLVNEFNDIVLNKSVDFLLKDIQTRNNTKINVKSSNTGLIESTILEPVKKKKSKKVKFNNIDQNLNDLNNVNDVQDQTKFLTNFDNFEEQVKAANKKIKDNFNQIISDSTDNFGIDMPSNTLYEPQFNPILNNSSTMFEQMLEKNLSESTDSLYDDYSNSEVSNMLSSIIKQPDNSNANELGENETTSNPLIITNKYEKPSLFYNNSENGGTYNINKKVLTIDSGSSTNPLVSVTNLGTKEWYKFRVDLQDTIKIDKLCDIYLRNISVVGISDNINCNYFVLDIDEFNIINYSNNPNLRNKIAINNTVSNTKLNKLINGDVTTSATVILDNTTDLFAGMVVIGAGITEYTTITSVNSGIEITISTSVTLADNAVLHFMSPSSSNLNINAGSSGPYITTINPSKLSTLTITATNQNNESVDDGDNKTFILQTNPLNRIIFELEFRTRSERDEMIYEQNVYNN